MRVDDFGAEREGEQIARRSLRQAAALQIEDFVGVELSDGRAVRALDVVGEDLELRLGVDTRFGRQQQIAARLRRIGALRAGRTRILPLNTACAAPSTMHLCSWRLTPSRLRRGR